MSIICPSCGTPAPPGAIFCDNCGYDLIAVSQYKQQPMPPTYHVPESDVLVQAEEQSGGVTCPSCGHVNIVGSVFCENCGAKLEQKTPASPPPYQPTVQEPPVKAQEQPVAPAPLEEREKKPTPPVTPQAFISGKLVVQSSNQEIKIPQGKQKILIGREDPVSGVFPDIDLEPYDAHEAGVGRQHAQLILIDGQIHLEDLDSVNGTFINKKRISPHQPQPVQDGDQIRMGKLVVNIHIS